jgi:hypothetical protein
MPEAEDPEEVKRLLEKARRRKDSPYLIPWADLLELDAEMDRRFGERMAGAAEYDRIAVREIPERLAAVGLQVIRMDTIAGVATKETPMVDDNDGALGSFPGNL